MSLQVLIVVVLLATKRATRESGPELLACHASLEHKWFQSERKKKMVIDAFMRLRCLQFLTIVPVEGRPYMVIDGPASYPRRITVWAKLVRVDAIAWPVALDVSSGRFAPRVTRECVH